MGNKKDKMLLPGWVQVERSIMKAWHYHQDGAVDLSLTWARRAWKEADTPFEALAVVHDSRLAVILNDVRNRLETP